MKKTDIEDVLKNYHITPDNLWVSFYLMRDSIRKFGASPIEYNFCLADNAKQIYVSNPNGVYGCAKLSEVQKTLKALNDRTLLIADSSLLGIWAAEIFIVAAEQNQKLLFYRIQALTSKKAISYISKIHPEINIVATGSQYDFDNLVQQMENICEKQDFLKISHDRRPDIDGLASYKLLLCKKNPSAFSNAFFDELHQEYL